MTELAHHHDSALFVENQKPSGDGGGQGMTNTIRFNVSELTQQLKNLPPSSEQLQRPLLIHLNADTSWLISLPLGTSSWPHEGSSNGGDKSSPHPGSTQRRSRFNILVDPWFRGPQSDVAAFFSTQWHVVEPSVHSIEELNGILCDMEACLASRGPIIPAAWADKVPNPRGKPGPILDATENASPAAETRGLPQSDPKAGEKSRCYIDAVVVSHEFTDHCHQATLEELPNHVPVFAADVAADLIRSWTHFDQVLTVPGLSPGIHWVELTNPDAEAFLPPFLRIGRLTSVGNALYYHAAMVIAFDSERGSSGPNTKGERAGEAILYSPHGIDSKDLAIVPACGLKTLALLHGLHDVKIWMMKQLNLGALNAIEAVSACGAKYWIATHDEVKKGGGIIGWLLQRMEYTLEDAVAHEREVLKLSGRAIEYEYVELGSGDGICLY